jgi:uridine kinase
LLYDVDQILAGATRSGKTTLARGLAEELPVASTPIHLDRFFNVTSFV